MSEVVLINITGRDRKGLDARFAGILAEYGVNILDVGQAVEVTFRETEGGQALPVFRPA